MKISKLYIIDILYIYILGTYGQAIFFVIIFLDLSAMLMFAFFPLVEGNKSDDVEVKEIMRCLK